MGWFQVSVRARQWSGKAANQRENRREARETCSYLVYRWTICSFSVAPIPSSEEGRSRADWLAVSPLPLVDLAALSSALPLFCLLHLPSWPMNRPRQ